MATASEKVCTTCGEPWPADVGFFRALVKSPDGLADQCNACVCDKYRRYRIRNPSRPRAAERARAIWWDEQKPTHCFGCGAELPEDHHRGDALPCGH